MEARLAASPAERRPDHPFRGACGAAAPGLGCAAPGLRWAARPRAGCRCRAPPPPAPSPPPAIVPTCSAPLPPAAAAPRRADSAAKPSPARPPPATPAGFPTGTSWARPGAAGEAARPPPPGQPLRGRGRSAQQRAPGEGRAAASRVGRAQVRAKASQLRGGCFYFLPLCAPY